MSIGECPPYSGGVVNMSGGLAGEIPLGDFRHAPNYAPRPIAQVYGEGSIDQKLKEIDEEIAKIHNSIDALRAVEVALCGACPTAYNAELKPHVVDNGLIDKLSSRKAELARAAETLTDLVIRLQTL